MQNFVDSCQVAGTLHRRETHSTLSKYCKKKGRIDYNHNRIIKRCVAHVESVFNFVSIWSSQGTFEKLITKIDRNNHFRQVIHTVRMKATYVGLARHRS